MALLLPRALNDSAFNEQRLPLAALTCCRMLPLHASVGSPEEPRPLPQTPAVLEYCQLTPAVTFFKSHQIFALGFQPGDQDGLRNDPGLHLKPGLQFRLHLLERPMKLHPSQLETFPGPRREPSRPLQPSTGRQPQEPRREQAVSEPASFFLSRQTADT